MKIPHLIVFEQIDNEEKGNFSVVNTSQIPFEVKRIFWIFNGKENRIAGEHAHNKAEQTIVALQGKIKITTETKSGEKHNFILDDSNKALFIPAQCWQKIEYIGNAALMCFSSIEYDPADYIRTYNEFKKL
ncbi:MAG: FdtA/QdtA family cupin domain-containing protein [Bacteroidia bacterium]